MSKRPDIRPVNPPAWQGERLARWLAEWEADHILRAGADGEPAVGPPAENARSRVTCGEIALLHPSVVPHAAGLVYVAVLESHAAGSRLIVPYGRFAEPATPHELLTGRSAPALRVLCCWNARVADSALLRRGWPVGRMTEGEEQDAWNMLSAIYGSPSLPPAGLEQRTGPPLRHPLDPRWEYLAEERARLGGLSAAHLEPFFRTHDAGGELPLAAEPEAPYGGEVRYSAEGTGLTLRLVWQSARRVYDVEVTDAAGAVSTALDGARLASAAGLLSEPVNNGRVVAHLQVVQGKLSLLLADGRTVALRRPAG